MYDEANHDAVLRSSLLRLMKGLYSHSANLQLQERWRNKLDDVRGRLDESIRQQEPTLKQRAVSPDDRDPLIETRETAIWILNLLETHRPDFARAPEREQKQFARCHALVTTLLAAIDEYRALEPLRPWLHACQSTRAAIDALTAWAKDLTTIDAAIQAALDAPINKYVRLSSSIQSPVGDIAVAASALVARAAALEAELEAQLGSYAPDMLNATLPSRTKARSYTLGALFDRLAGVELNGRIVEAFSEAERGEFLDDLGYDEAEAKRKRLERASDYVWGWRQGDRDLCSSDPQAGSVRWRGALKVRMTPGESRAVPRPIVPRYQFSRIKRDPDLEAETEETGEGGGVRA